jgi:7-cyano-7-deazaguanine synthase in queuosine biosynthesis
VGYATLRIYKTIKQHNNPCYGCKECELREQIRKNQAAKRQKQDKPDCFNKK